MLEVFVATIVFVFSHVALARWSGKARIIARLGRPAWLAVYSSLSLLLLAWVALALTRSPRIELWAPPAWGHVFALPVSAAAFALMGAGSLIANPLSIGFRSGRPDPARPGLVGLTRHPLLLGFALWGVAHTPANGDWPSLLLFGGTVLFAWIGARLLDARRRRALGDKAWRALAARPPGVEPEAWLGAGIGMALWAAALILHPSWFGVDPWSIAIAGRG